MGACLVKPRVTVGDNEDRDQSIDDSATVEPGAGGDEDSDVEVSLDDELLCSLNEMASNLCSTCRGFPRGHIENIGDYSDCRVYHPSLSSLQESVDAGCRICKDLSQSVNTFFKKFESPATLTQPWSIHCTLWKNIDWNNHVDSPRHAFNLTFDICEGGRNDAVRSTQEIIEGTLAHMAFFPADCLGLGPEFLGMSTGQGVNLLLPWLTSPRPQPKNKHRKIDNKHEFDTILVSPVLIPSHVQKLETGLSRSPDPLDPSLETRQ